MRKMRYVWLVVLCIVVSGCTRYAQPATPLEQEEQEDRMREFLNDSSPRNMNDHPKVTPEFTRSFNTRGSAPSPSSLESSKTGEEENW